MSFDLNTSPLTLNQLIDLKIHNLNQLSNKKVTQYILNLCFSCAEYSGLLRVCEISSFHYNCLLQLSDLTLGVLSETLFILELDGDRKESRFIV